MFINLIVWIVFGALAGWIASLVVRTDVQRSSIPSMLIGIAGAVAGGWVAGILGTTTSGLSGVNVPSLMIAIFGAIISLLVIKTAQHS